MANRSDASCLHPEWTEEETSILIEAWRDVEYRAKAKHPTRKKLEGSVDVHIAKQLSRRPNNTRTSAAIGRLRCNLYKAIRFISRFDEMQQSSGGRLWFELSKRERDGVEVPANVRKTSYTLARESFNTLVKLKSVRKWTKVRRAKVPTPKADVSHPSKCHSCWSTSEVRDLVRSWSLVMKKSKTSVRAFVAKSSDQSATSYTPWSHSTMSAWRKMKRIATSYLFIREFNEHNAPANWFQLSDGAQNMWIDWDSLPADFEDITQGTFDEIHSVDFSFSNQGVGSGKSYRTTKGVPQTDNVLKPKLRTVSPQFPHPNPIRIHKSAKQVRDSHQECNALYEEMEQLQKKQFKQAIQRLRTDIEGDIRCCTDTERAIFFERLGDPSQSGDATFVANILDDQQRQVRNRFAQFQREHVYENADNDYVFDTTTGS